MIYCWNLPLATLIYFLYIYFLLTHFKQIVEDNSGTSTLFNISNVTNLAGTLDNLQNVDTSNLVIDTRGEHERRKGSTKNNVVTHSADAIEGLQALAEQAGLVNTVIEEQVTTEVRFKNIIFDSGQIWARSDSG